MTFGGQAGHTATLDLWELELSPQACEQTTPPGQLGSSIGDTPSGGTLTFEETGGQDVVLDSSTTLNGDLVLSAGDNDNLTIEGAGSLELGGNTLTFDGADSDSVINVPIQGDSDSVLEMTGGGTTELGGDVQVGTLFCSGGKLVISGNVTADEIVVAPGVEVVVMPGAVLNGPITVSGTLKGEGTIDGPVTISGGGVFDPGKSPGAMTVNGDLNFDEFSTLRIEIEGDQSYVKHDQIVVNGAVVISDNVNLEVVATLEGELGMHVNFIHNDGTDEIDGVFSGLEENATIAVGAMDYPVSYMAGDGNDIAVKANNVTIPTLSQWEAMLRAGLLGLLAFRKAKSVRAGGSI